MAEEESGAGRLPFGDEGTRARHEFELLRVSLNQHSTPWSVKRDDRPHSFAINRSAVGRVGGGIAAPRPPQNRACAIVDEIQRRRPVIEYDWVTVCRDCVGDVQRRLHRTEPAQSKGG